MLDYFSNACVAYKILTNHTYYICVYVVQLSKIKIDKSYLRQNMSQELLPMEKEIFLEVEKKHNQQ